MYAKITVWYEFKYVLHKILFRLALNAKIILHPVFLSSFLIVGLMNGIQGNLTIFLVLLTCYLPFSWIIAKSCYDHVCFLQKYQYWFSPAQPTLSTRHCDLPHVNHCIFTTQPESHWEPHGKVRSSRVWTGNLPICSQSLNPLSHSPLG